MLPPRLLGLGVAGGVAYILPGPSSTSESSASPSDGWLVSASTYPSDSESLEGDTLFNRWDKGTSSSESLVDCVTERTRSRHEHMNLTSPIAELSVTWWICKVFFTGCSRGSMRPMSSADWSYLPGNKVKLYITGFILCQSKELSGVSHGHTMLCSLPMVFLEVVPGGGNTKDRLVVLNIT